MTTRANAAAMRVAAEELIGGLSPQDAARLVHPFEGDDRTDWTAFPLEMVGKNFLGVPLFDLDFGRRKLVTRLVETGVSLGGFAQIAAIQALEMPLDVMEGHRITELRDRSRYWVAIFGTPSDTGTWGWRFEGHHVGINSTIIGGEVVASTPNFLGSNPARVRNGDHDISRPCGPEEDAGRQLLAEFDADERAVAVLTDHAPFDNMTAWLPAVPDWAEPGNPPNPVGILQDVLVVSPQEAKDAVAYHRTSPRGVRRGDLASAQQATLDELLEIYLRRLPDAMAAVERARIDEAGRDEIHFAWAGTDVVGDAHYYRLQGPTVLIEYDNAQNDANHVHAVWRDPERDFAYDLLRAHKASEA